MAKIMERNIEEKKKIGKRKVPDSTHALEGVGGGKILSIRRGSKGVLQTDYGS